MTTLAAPTPLAPVRPALAGFTVAGVILVVLDAHSPAAAVTETISAHAATAARALFVLAMVASGLGVALALAGGWRQVAAGRATDLALLGLWPLGIGIASIVDQDTLTAAPTWTGTLHNVAVGTAIVGVHLAALRTRSRPLTALVTAGAATMAALLVLIALHMAGVPGVPVGVAERVLVVVSAALAVGALRARRPVLSPP